MLLSDIVPLAKIEAVIGAPLSVQRLNSGDWRELAARDSEDVYGIAGRVWHLAVSSPDSHLNPMALAPYFQRFGDPSVAGAVEKALGRPLFKEFGFMEATASNNGQPFRVATSLVAHLTEAELHWYDIALFNPAK